MPMPDDDTLNAMPDKTLEQFVAESQRPSVLDPIDMDLLENGIEVPTIDWEYLYIINMYVDLKIPGLPKFGSELQDMMYSLDNSGESEMQITKPIVGIICKFLHELSEDELKTFVGGIERTLAAHYIKYSQLELAHIERRART